MTGCECDTCWYYDYDEEYDEYFCMMDLDEDEVYRFFVAPGSRCPIIGRVMTIPWQGGSKHEPNMAGSSSGIAAVRL